MDNDESNGVREREERRIVGQIKEEGEKDSKQTRQGESRSLILFLIGLVWYLRLPFVMVD